MKNSVLLFALMFILACNALMCYAEHSAWLCFANITSGIIVGAYNLRRRNTAYLAPLPYATEPDAKHSTRYPKASMLKPLVPEGAVIKVTRNGLSPERRLEIVTRILEQMETAKLYQETELTLQQLAEALGVPAYQVSIALNEGLNKTFYDLVNGYRVEEAKRLLRDERNLNFTILSVGFDAGFNSKTTFNTVFKKFTGLTPTDYRSRYGSRLQAA